ncbi:type II toxin-antitoxin system HipA family toxin [Modicisalibacter luteus]|uniref:type II toxin-antitoxin system HipA family toxin n=1 Tax=Modicisalibacter luteus TaxID=453962 RepID=UPI00364447E4
MPLTLQLFHQGQWHDAAELTIADPTQGRQGPVALGYETNYALEWMDRDDEHACSMNLPVELMLNHHSSRWFGFLDDIMPAGASRRYWVSQLGIGGLPAHQQDYALLHHGTIAPVGNLRIKESLPELPQTSRLTRRRFPLQEVVERHTDFLEYAQQMGAASGGATGAGGEAPKLLLRCTLDDRIWIDTFQADLTCQDRHYLVKFPRGKRSSIDADILRAEYHYYQELASLGLETIDTEHMRLIEGSRDPSLWLPRFDVAFVDGRRTLFGLESVYAVMERPPGTYLNHFDVIRTLVSKLSQQYRVTEGSESFNAEAFVVEMVKRDLLNVAFGNSDNHGRNTALIKRPEGIWLAPIYDFAPMKADPEGVTRTLQWGPPMRKAADLTGMPSQNNLPT